VAERYAALAKEQVGEYHPSYATAISWLASSIGRRGGWQRPSRC
jgi:hypothetical protein